MSDLHVELAADAKELIEENGRSVTLYAKSRTAANPTQPWRGPSATPGDTFSAILAMVPASTSAFGSILGKAGRDKDGTLVRTIEQVGLLASTSTTAVGKDLNNFDSLLDGTKLYRVVAVEELKPGATSLIWVLGMRSAE